MKLGHDDLMGHHLPTEEEVVDWYRGKGDPEVAAYLKSALQALMPDVHFLSWETRSCVISKVRGKRRRWLV